MNQEELKLLDQNEKKLCAGGCGTPVGIDAIHFPEDEGYKYCHSYCCVCCPDFREPKCDKELNEEIRAERDAEYYT